MTSLKRGAAFTAAGVLAVAGAGAGAGAGLYAAFSPGDTTTVNAVTTVDRAQPAASTAGLTINDIYQRSNQGVVDITVRTGGGSQLGQFGGSQSSQAEGSGFVYDTRGDIITNEHVVDGATSITVNMADGKSYTAHLVGSDNSTDLAVVKISAPASALHPLTLGDSSKVEVGDPVVAIGSPFGLAGTVTSGIVSALHRSIQSPNNYPIGDAIQTDAPINHGNSGGPLIDAGGHVIGVNSQIQSDSGGSDGVGFAIPSNTLASVAEQIVAGKTVAHAYLGVQVENSSSPAGAKLAQGAPRHGGRQGRPQVGRHRDEARRQGRRRAVGPLGDRRRQAARREAQRHLRPQRAGAHDRGHPRRPPRLIGRQPKRPISGTAAALGPAAVPR